MELRAAERLVVALLAGRHLHQRRPGQEDLRALLDHDHVVGEAGLVGPARGRRSEHHAHGGDAELGKLDHLVEGPAALREVLGLRPAPPALPSAAPAGLHSEVGAGGLDETDVRDPVVAGDLDRPHPLLDRVRGERAAENRGIVAHHHALDAGYHADAHDHAATGDVIRAVAGEGTDLQERAVGIEHVGDAFPNRQLAPRPHALDGGRPSPGIGLVEQLLDHGELLEHVGAVALERLSPGVEHRWPRRGEQRGHEPDIKAGNVQLSRLPLVTNWP